MLINILILLLQNAINIHYSSNDTIKLINNNELIYQNVSYIKIKIQGNISLKYIIVVTLDKSQLTIKPPIMQICSHKYKPKCKNICHICIITYQVINYLYNMDHYFEHIDLTNRFDMKNICIYKKNSSMLNTIFRINKI